MSTKWKSHYDVVGCQMRGVRWRRSFWLVRRGRRGGYLHDVLAHLPKMTNHDDLAAISPSNWQPPAVS